MSVADAAEETCEARRRTSRMPLRPSPRAATLALALALTLALALALTPVARVAALYPNKTPYIDLCYGAQETSCHKRKIAGAANPACVWSDATYPNCFETTYFVMNPAWSEAPSLSLAAFEFNYGVHLSEGTNQAWYMVDSPDECAQLCIQSVVSSDGLQIRCVSRRSVGRTRPTDVAARSSPSTTTRSSRRRRRRRTTRRTTRACACSTRRTRTRRGCGTRTRGSRTRSCSVRLRISGRRGRDRALTRARQSASGDAVGDARRETGGGTS